MRTADLQCEMLMLFAFVAGLTVGIIIAFTRADR
jgi:xanthosine utilization system XapX-like protein